MYSTATAANHAPSSACTCFHFPSQLTIYLQACSTIPPRMTPWVTGVQRSLIQKERVALSRTGISWLWTSILPRKELARKAPLCRCRWSSNRHVSLIRLSTRYTHVSPGLIHSVAIHRYRINRVNYCRTRSNIHPTRQHGRRTAGNSTAY